ncbi:transcriptional coactivator Hfi1/Transcriptional adapter 1, partial [Jimgerdemannia flammicorona]
MPSTAPPTTTAPPTGRQELLNIKHKLVDALADNAPQYWDALREFVTGKLNRQEFDFYANLFLNRQNAPLHNAFILATIHNAQKDFPSPANQHGANSQRRKRPIKDEDDDVAGVGGVRQEAKKKKRDNMSLDKTERERIKELAK